MLHGEEFKSGSQKRKRGGNAQSSLTQRPRIVPSLSQPEAKLLHNLAPMSLTKKLLLAAAGLLTLIVVALFALILSFDPNRYKGVAIDWVKDHYGRTLRLDGPITLGVIPRLEVRLDRVALSEAPPAAAAAAAATASAPADFVRLESAALSVRLWPLLHKELVVDEVRARGLAVHYSRDAAGHQNIDDLLGPPKGAKPAEAAASKPVAAASGAAAGGSPLRFDVNAIVLEQIQARIDDEIGHTHGDVSLDLLRTGRIGPELMTPIELALKAKLSQPAIEAGLKGSLKLRFDPGAQSEDAPKRPMVLSTRDLDLNLSLATPAISLNDTRLKLASFDLLPQSQQIGLEQLMILVQGQLKDAQGAHPLKVELNWPKLAVQGEQLQGAPIAGSFSLEGPAAVQGRIESGAPAGSFSHLRVPAFKLVLGGATGPTRMSGSIQADLRAQPPTAEYGLDKLVIDAQVQDPNLKPIALKAAGQVAVKAKQTLWQLAGQINQQDFKIDGQFDAPAAPGARARLATTARFGELDLDALLPPRAPKAPEAAASAPAADIPVSLAGLKAIDADVDLRINQFRYKPYALNDVVVHAKLDGGHLQVAPLGLKAWSGQIDGQITASANTNPAQQAVGVRLNAAGIEIQNLLKDVANLDLLAGKGTVKVDVTTHGASVNAFKAALNGNAAVQLRDGAIQGINLARSLREFKASLSLKQDAVQAAKQTEKTDFSELNATFQILDGVANNRDLDMKSPFLRLGGSGWVNLPTSSLDYTARATVTGTAQGQGSTDAALKGLTVPVRLNGPFTAMSWKIQWGDIATGAAGNTLKQGLNQAVANSGAASAAEKAKAQAQAQAASASQQLKDKAQEQVQNKLKGLFGR